MVSFLIEKQDCKRTEPATYQLKKEKDNSFETRYQQRLCKRRWVNATCSTGVSTNDPERHFLEGFFLVNQKYNCNCRNKLLLCIHMFL